MRFNFKMPMALKPFYKLEVASFRVAFIKNDLNQAWRHLERAHVIGQAYPIEHSEVHFMMLRFGIQIKSTKEIIGQMPRLLVGGVKSFVGVIPVGNTGGSNVHPLKSMPIDSEIQQMFKLAGIANMNA